MKKNGYIAILILLVMAGVYYAYSLGVFSAISVQKASRGPFHMVYLEYTGPYSGVGPVFERVEKFLKDEKIIPEGHAGLYFDDPAHLEETKLRSHAGAVISEQDYIKLEQSGGKEFHLRILPRAEYVFAQFPFRNFFSILLGIQKVYPALNEYAKNHNYPEYSYKETGYENSYIMEVYYSDRIEYIMPGPQN